MLVQAFQSSNIGAILIIIPGNECSAVIIVPGASGTAPGPPGAPPGHRYHLGSHFGTILDSFGGGLRGFKKIFLVFLGLLKFVKNSPIKPVLGNVGTGSLHCVPER